MESFFRSAELVYRLQNEFVYVLHVQDRDQILAKRCKEAYSEKTGFDMKG